MHFDLSSLPITNQKTIPAEYIDVMGHMNVMWYTHLFDYGTRALFELFGFMDDYVRRTGMGSFALETHVRYYSEVHQGEHVTVRSRLLDRSDKVIHFMHFMVRGTDQILAATCEVIVAHADLDNRRIIPIPPEVTEPLDVLLSKHQQLSWQAPVCGVMGVRREQPG